MIELIINIIQWVVGLWFVGVTAYAVVSLIEAMVSDHYRKKKRLNDLLIMEAEYQRLKDTYEGGR